MADTKISALTSATTPLAGTEVLPIVQSSTTKQVSVANLTAGRAVSAASLSLTTTPLTVANGGTGLSSFTAGDLPYYVSGTTLTGLAIGAANRVLTSSGSAPQWSTSLNLSGSITSGGTLQALATVQSSSGADLSLNANGANRDVIVKVNGTEVSRFVGSTGNQTIANGNLVPSTAAKGINFTANTPAAGMTSQLLNWYEEGTFTPTAAGSSSAGVGTYTNQTGVYTRIGRIVHVYITISWTAHTGTGNLKITGLPFSASGNQVASMFANGLTYTGTHLQPFTSGTEILLSQTSSGASDSYIPIDTSCQLFFTVAYYVA